MLKTTLSFYKDDDYANVCIANIVNFALKKEQWQLKKTNFAAWGETNHES